MGKVKLTKAQRRVLEWIEANEHHFAGWDDSWSKLTLRGKRQITISATDWNTVNTAFIGPYDETRKRVFTVNESGRAALKES